jgi:hypothetical protein
MTSPLRSTGYKEEIKMKMAMKALVFCFILSLAAANSAHSMGWFSHDHQSDGNGPVMTRGGDTKGGPMGVNENPIADGKDPGSFPVPEPNLVLLLASGLLVLGIAIKVLRSTGHKEE